MHSSKNGWGPAGNAGIGQLDRKELERLHGKGASDPLIGTVINGRYKLESRLGRGGMARVYLAIDMESGDNVAVKVMDGQADRMEELTYRFLREVKAAASINNSHVVEIFNMGTFGGDQLFYVMEYLDGADLSKAFDKKTGMDPVRARLILEQACIALDAAHNHVDAESREKCPIIHRDIKPENIFIIQRNGKEFVKVLDFGLAKVVQADSKLTRDRDVLGTTTYIAWEQAWTSDCDHRADIYSLGAIGYELLCGEPPFRSDDPDERKRVLQVLLAHKEKQPLRPSIRRPDLNIPRDLENVIMRALEKDPARRFQSAKEMKDALAACRRKDELEAEDEEELPPVIVKGAEAAKPAARQAPTKVEEILGAPPVEEAGAWTRFKRFMKKILAIGIIGTAIGYPAYYYRHEIADFVREAKNYLFNDTGPRPAQDAAPAPPSAASVTYDIRVESDPSGASVYDICSGERGKRLLGVTPLHIPMAGGQHTLLLTKRGYQQKQLVVSSAQPEHRLTLNPARRRPPPMAAPGEGSGAAPQESAGPSDGGSGSGREGGDEGENGQQPQGE